MKSGLAASMDGHSRRVWVPLLYLLGLIVTVFVADRAGSVLLGQAIYLSDHRLARIYARNINADILILGNSGANAMVIPGELANATGMTSFTLAVHALDAETQKVLIGDFLARNRLPKVAILEIRPSRVKETLAPNLNLFTPFSEALRHLVDQQHNGWIPWADVFTLYRFNSSMLPLVLERIVDRHDQKKGPSNGKITEAMKRRWKVPADDDDVPRQIEAFAESVRMLRRAGVRPIVVVAPIHPVTTQSSGWLDRSIQKVASAVGSETRLYQFQTLFDGDEVFEDPTHLNQKGRQAFLPYLAAAVAERDTTAGPTAEVR